MRARLTMSAAAAAAIALFPVTSGAHAAAGMDHGRPGLLLDLPDASARSHVEVGLVMGCMSSVLFFGMAAATSTWDPADVEAAGPDIPEDGALLRIPWQPMLGPVFTAPVEIATTFLWHRFRPGRQRLFKLAVVPVYREGVIEGASLGLSIRL